MLVNISAMSLNCCMASTAILILGGLLLSKLAICVIKERVQTTHYFVVALTGEYFPSDAPTRTKSSKNVQQSVACFSILCARRFKELVA